MDSEISDNGKSSASLQHVEPSPRLLKKSLHVSSSSVSPSSPLSPTVSASLSATSSSENLLATTDPMEHLDCFLRDALNSRNRITVLRLELEIEKFLRNPRQQQLILNSMPSSYERLVAHRVAQHYQVQSMALDSIPPARILLVKTLDSRVPSVKLADVPIDSSIESKSVTPPPGKLAIKQRSKEGSLGSGSATSGRVTPIRSVEERMEDYNKARARIFSNGDIGRSSEPPALNEAIYTSGSERDECEEDILVKAANTVAVFRDRQKDMKDPDYDRSYDRYSQAMKAASLIPSTTSSVCSSSSYGAGLVTQGGYGQPQRQVYCAASENHGCFWVGAGAVPVIGYPNVLPSAFTQGFYSRPSNVYNCNQEFAYPRHYSSVDWRQCPTKVEPCSMLSTNPTRRFQTS